MLVSFSKSERVRRFSFGGDPSRNDVLFFGYDVKQTATHAPTLLACLLRPMAEEPTPTPTLELVGPCGHLHYVRDQSLLIS